MCCRYYQTYCRPPCGSLANEKGLFCRHEFIWDRNLPNANKLLKKALVFCLFQSLLFLYILPGEFFSLCCICSCVLSFHGDIFLKFSLCLLILWLSVKDIFMWMLFSVLILSYKNWWTKVFDHMPEILHVQSACWDIIWFCN